MDFLIHVALILLYTILFVIIITSVMTFIDVPADSYNPFMYYMILLLLFHLFLS
jgi:hypothetical protein